MRVVSIVTHIIIFTQFTFSQSTSSLYYGLVKQLNGYEPIYHKEVTFKPSISYSNGAVLDLNITFEDHKVRYQDSHNCGCLTFDGNKFTLPDSVCGGIFSCIDPLSLEMRCFDLGSDTFYSLSFQSCLAGKTVGSSTILYLFRVSSSNITFYPLCSRYGSIECFSDLNGDGQLDFTKISREWTDGDIEVFNFKTYSLSSNSTRFIESAVVENYPFTITSNSQKRLMAKKYRK
jgi:hypothetical protein